MLIVCNTLYTKKKAKTSFLWCITENTYDINNLEYMIKYHEKYVG